MSSGCGEQQAVVVRDGFSYVFGVGPDNRVQQRKVRVGRRSLDRIGLAHGELLGRREALVEKLGDIKEMILA